MTDSILNNKYSKIYNQIIEKRKSNLFDGSYYEIHHILPKSLGGSDDSSNLVRLSAKEHFICHYLLTKMFPENTVPYYKMLNAFIMMKCSSLNQKRYFSNLYSYAREKYAEHKRLSQTGTGNSQYGTCWISNESLELSTRIKLGEPLPFGWVYGRRTWIKKKKYHEKKLKSKQKELEFQESESIYYNDLFIKFIDSDCNSVREFVLNGNYKYSVVNLTKKWKKYVSEYNKNSQERKKFKSRVVELVDTLNC